MNNFLIPAKKHLSKYWQLYILSLPVLIYIVIFKYLPMYGVQIAFRDFQAKLGFFKSPWVGFEHFERFFRSYIFKSLIRNTLTISLYSLLLGFPIPIILAIMLNEVRNPLYKSTVQMVTYAPHFISTIVVASMITIMLNKNTGIVNILLSMIGFDRIDFLSKPEYFKHIYVFSDIWQSAGWDSIIFLSALSSIDQELYESALMDGVTKIKKIIFIDIPCILPTIVILLIMRSGHIMSVGFEKAFLLQNDLNKSASEIISTYVYQIGLQKGDYSFSSAVGLFNSVINLIMLFAVNKATTKLSGHGLWKSQ